jgi:nitrate reductase gamma subunit
VTDFFDTVFLAIVFTILVSGVLIAVFYRWGSSWGAMTLGPYVASLVSGQPAVQLATQMPALVQLHVLATFAAIAVVPLTRLSTFLVACARFDRADRQAISRGGNAVTEWSRTNNPGRWFWPEED